MRWFWVGLILGVAMVAAGLIYAPPLVVMIGAGALLIILIGFFYISLRLAGARYEGGLEQGELRGIVAGLSDALLVYDQNLRIIFFNPAAATLFGLRSEEIVGERVRPQDVENPKRRLLVQVMFPSLAPVLVPRSKSGEYPQVADLSFSEPELELRVATTPIADQGGKIGGFLKIIQNRTREAQLLRSKNEFITVASHQLRTPITEIHWALESLSQEAGLSQSSKLLAEQTLGSARRLLELVEDLLSISKIEEGRFGYNFESGDLLAFLDKTLADFLPAAKRLGLKLYLDRPKEQLSPVMFDQQKLGMVTSNLVDNAIRYNTKGGEVLVTIKKSERGPFLEVKVKDTGIGIPASEIQKTFTKFFRSSSAVKFQTEGTGLGLYIAKNIIAAHGGEMWAESEEGRGSSFYFTLPTNPALIPKSELPIE